MCDYEISSHFFYLEWPSRQLCTHKHPFSAFAYAVVIHRSSIFFPCVRERQTQEEIFFSSGVSDLDTIQTTPSFPDEDTYTVPVFQGRRQAGEAIRETRKQGEKGREQTSSVWIVLEAEILYSFCNPVDYHNSIRAARNLKNSTWQIGVHIYWIKLIKSVLRTTLTWREDSFCSRRFFVRIFFFILKIVFLKFIWVYLIL